MKLKPIHLLFFSYSNLVHTMLVFAMENPPHTISKPITIPQNNLSKDNLDTSPQQWWFSKIGEGLRALQKSTDPKVRKDYILDAKNPNLYEKIRFQVEKTQDLAALKQALLPSDQNNISKIYNRAYYTNIKLNEILSDPASYDIHNPSFKTNLSILTEIFEINKEDIDSILIPQLKIIVEKYLGLCQTEYQNKSQELSDIITASIKNKDSIE